MKMKKYLLLAILVFVIAALAFLWYASGGILGEILFDRPSTPDIKHGEFPFELVYEYNNEQFTIQETIICDYQGISYAVDGGNYRDWDCYITNNNEYGQYYIDKEKYPSLHIQVPLCPDYYMGLPDANYEYITPYIFFADDTTGTTYYEQDSIDSVGVKIISWNWESIPMNSHN